MGNYCKFNKWNMLLLIIWISVSHVSRTPCGLALSTCANGVSKTAWVAWISSEDVSGWRFTSKKKTLFIVKKNRQKLKIVKKIKQSV